MQTASPCPEAQQWERFGQGQVQSEDVERLARHLEECPRCGNTMEQLLDRDTLVEALRAVPVEIRQGEQDVLRRLADRVREFRPSDTDSIGAATRAEKPTPVEGPDPERTQELYDFLAPPQEAGELGRLGSYRVLKLLGAGGMGVVFQAEDSRLKRVVALKVILDARAADPGYLARFHQEAEVVARLRDPHIVQIHEVGKHRGRPYLALEYVGGGSLAQQLGGQPQPARPSADLVQTLARAMHHAHEQGVIHRDLKPSNILLQEEETTNNTNKEKQDNQTTAAAADPSSGSSLSSSIRLVRGFTPKIADFGLAKRLDEGGLTQTGELLGTPGYMAPEQAGGPSKDIGPAADVYALGAILYECLTGRPPFKAATVLETLEQMRSQDPVPPGLLQSRLPRDLQTICLKCLNKEPRRRYASAAALADDLGRFLRGEPVRARPVSLRVRLWKWARRKPALAALLVVSGLSLAALVAGDQVYSARLRAAVKQARDSATEARQQQQRADAGYRAARDALDRMLRHLERRRLGEVPQLKELQRDQCDDALAFYQGVLAVADDPDPAVRLDAARAFERAATIQTLLSRYTDAVQSYGQAIDLVGALPAAQRELPEAQELLAICYSDRGLISGRPADREEDLDKALAIKERLAREKPDDSGRQDSLAATEHQLGQVLMSASRLAAAESHYARAVAIRTRLTQDHPQEESYQVALAEDHVNLGLLYANTGREAEAIAAYEKAEALLRPLIARHPEDVRQPLALAAADTNWGLLLGGKGQRRAAVARCTEAVEMAETALRREPSHYMAREVARNAHGARAQNSEALGRWAEAARDWDRVVELDDLPNSWARRVLRALALARAGDHTRAVAEAAALACKPEVTADGVWELARVYALAVGPARSDARLPTAERAALAERCAVGAVSLLRKLQGEGYFEDAAHAKALRTDENLQPLRGREDFRQLLAAVGNR